MMISLRSLYIDIHFHNTEAFNKQHLLLQNQLNISNNNNLLLCIIILCCFIIQVYPQSILEHPWKLSDSARPGKESETTWSDSGVMVVPNKCKRDKQSRAVLAC